MVGPVVSIVGGLLALVVVAALVRSWFLAPGRASDAYDGAVFVGGVQFAGRGGRPSMRRGVSYPFATLIVCEDNVVIEITRTGQVAAAPIRPPLAASTVFAIREITQAEKFGLAAIRFRIQLPDDERDGLVFWPLPWERSRILAVLKEREVPVG